MRIQFMLTCADNGQLSWVESTACVSHLIMAHTHTSAHCSCVSMCVEGSLLKNSIIEIANNNRLKVTTTDCAMWETFYTLSLPFPLVSPPLSTSLPVFHSHFLFVMNMSRHFVDCITIELRLVIYLLALHLINFLCNLLQRAFCKFLVSQATKNSTILSPSWSWN